MKRIVTLLLACAMVFTSSSCIQRKKRYEAQFLQLFDTVTTMVAYMDSRVEFEEFSVLIHDSLEEYHTLFDIYHDYEGIPNIKTINDNAGKRPVKVDSRIIDLLKFSKQAYTRTQGRCNIALGAVLKIWHDYREAGIDDPQNAALPKLSQLQEAAKHTDINHIIIDEGNSTVFLSDAEMSIDVGGVAKGYATEKVALLAKDKGYTSALLSVGGNVRAIGSKDGKGKPWNVGIQDPDASQGNTDLLVTAIDDKSVVTSGSYQRYYTVDGKRYHHIINPETLMPSTYFKAVTIICRDSGIADELSTALYNMPYEQGVEYIDSLPETEALWILENGEIGYSSKFKQYIKEQL
ncbi:MAG TPA: FAD:protein FMN transferase [Ruminococcaceae bacterium]|nr:FAD:protein FMN transferase [Oscillospiraceae bacterium]HCA30017.1 FAD:protein FMN transferase [Oscillospiraceae bacterium]